MNDTFPSIWLEINSPRTNKILIGGFYNLVEPSTLNNFIGNAARLWNKAPSNIINAKTISVAKKEIKAYCKTIPI